MEPAVAPEDVRDGLDLALRSFDVIVDVKVKQSVDVLADQRPGEVRIILQVVYLNERPHLRMVQLPEESDSRRYTNFETPCWPGLH